jgi:hypothetical protein
MGGFAVSGTGAGAGVNSVANLYTVSGTGNFPVTGIDLAVGYSTAPDAFYASIWTDSNGSPGSQVAGAYWSLFASDLESDCCSLVSVTGITGVTLTGGQQYFMFLGPLSAADNSDNEWHSNNQGVTGLTRQSVNGGWAVTTGNSLGAFDVTSDAATPEPATWPMLLGLAGMGLWRRFRRRSAAT